MKKLIILIVIGFGFFSVCRAKVSPELASQLETQLQMMDQAVAGADADPGSAEIWYLKAFWLRTNLQFGFDVPGFANMTVVPEVELLWQRENPQDWLPYRP